MTPAGSVSRMAVPVLHVVTDDTVLARPDFLDVAAGVLRSGGAAVALHLRGPRTGGGKLFALAEKIRPLGEDTGGLLVINDRVDVALAAGITAVQVGARSLPVAEALRILGAGGRVGASVHDVSAARTACADGSAWLFVGTLFATPTHPGLPAAGCGLIGDVSAVAGVPLLGIGGVTVARVAEVKAAGAAGVAVIRGVWDAPDPAGAVGDYLVALA